MHLEVCKLAVRQITTRNGLFSVRRLMSANSFMRDKSFINGQWIAANDGSTFEVINPANRELLGNVANVGASQTDDAIKAAHEAFPAWKKLTAKDRGKILRKWAELSMANQDELAKLLTLENGKPIADARGEIAYGSGFIEWFAEEAKRLYGEIIPTPVNSKRYAVIRQPIGVVGMITPWNFPNAMITRKAAAALAVGCTVVVKPGEDTPYSALALAQLASEAGLPPGVFNVVTCGRDKAAAVGKALCKSSLVTALSFTGSTATGKVLLEQCASTVKKVSLELGGNAPFIVFDSANIDLAVKGAISSRFRCSGQTCVCANRVLVQEGVHKKFVAALAEAMNSLKCGDGLDPATTQGPLINQRAVDKIEGFVRDAQAKGGLIIHGGHKPMESELFYEPTLISNANVDMKCVQEETFGPVLPVLKFKTEEEAVMLANATTAGLAGYFYSSNVAQCWRVAEQLDYGMVGVNESILSAVEAPFGGWKESGLGREGARQGLDEFTESKLICFGNLS